MAFVNQFQPDQFFNQKVKVLKVVCEVSHVNETGTVPAVPLTLFTNITIDPISGLITDTVTGQILTLSVVPVNGTSIVGGQTGVIPGMNGKVTNSMLITVNVVDQFGTIRNTVAITVTISGIIETGCDLEVNDTVQKHDIQFRGGNVSPAISPFGDLGLNVTAVVEVCIIVSRETVLKINAADLFCN